MYCSICGQQLRNDAKFCSKCGSVIKSAANTTQAAAVAPNPFQQTQIAGSPNSAYGPAASYCVVCNQAHPVERVSVIYREGVQEFTGSTNTWVSDKDGGYWTSTPVTGTTVSKQASRLAPPVDPKPPSLFLWYIMPFTGLSSFLIWFSPIPRARKLFILTLYLICYIALISSSPWSLSNNKPNGFQLIGIFVAIFIAIVLLVFHFIVYFIDLNKESNRRRQLLAATELPVWQRAKEKWERLYYCRVKDFVYDISTGEAAPVDQLNKFLYK